MTFRTISGLTFRMWSPSLYELCAIDIDDKSPISLVSIALVGRMWYIDILMKAGHSIHRGPFRTRDEAAALLAGRRQEFEGMNKWIKYDEAPTQIRQCFHDQIVPPKLGQNRVVIGSLIEGIVLFWFDNYAIIEYMIVPRPEGW